MKEELTASSHREPVRPTTGRVVNFVGFQMGWFACVLGAAHGLPWLGPLLVLCLFLLNLVIERDYRAAVRLAVISVAIGVPFDTLLQQTGLLGFASPWEAVPTSPPWLAAMWVNFALTLNSSLRWLLGRPVLAGLLGAIGGPIAYWAGERLGAVEVTGERWIVLIVLAALWAFAVPLLCVVAEKGKEKR